MERWRDSPFFLYFVTTLPHFSDFDSKSPQALDIPYDSPYTGEDWPQIEKNYAAMVRRLDGHIGRLMAQVKRLGLDEDTVVFCSSDNGPSVETAHSPAFFGSGGPFRGVKREMHEGAVRVPMVVRWPGNVPPGQVSQHPWAFWDFLPTAAEIAGVSAPSGIDGFSVLPALQGKPHRVHEYFYLEVPPFDQVKEQLGRIVMQKKFEAHIDELAKNMKIERTLQ